MHLLKSPHREATMAASLPSQSSLHSKSSLLPLKALYGPRLARPSTLSLPSKLSYAPMRENGFVSNCSIPFKESNYGSSTGSNNRVRQIPLLSLIIMIALLIISASPFTAGRYHSLVIEKDSFPSEELDITAWTTDGLIMAARHKKYEYLQGVQFHPESIITSEGKTIIHNFIKMIEKGG